MKTERLFVLFVAAVAITAVSSIFVGLNEYVNFNIFDQFMKLIAG